MKIYRWNLVIAAYALIYGITDVEPKHHATRSITIVGDNFVLDGKPLQIVSGSFHYFRVPAAYWRDRLIMLKAAGLNTVSTYVEWSFHEPEERQYRFDGDHDVAEFIRLAGSLGLHVLLRPGPYICAERDLGGLPYWLLSKYPNIGLRTKDKNFIEETEIWFNKLFDHLTPLLYGNQGPIIMVQVENEYGSYGDDKEYMGLIRDVLLRHVGTNALLYTVDGAYRSMFTNGSVDGALTTIDFGVGTNVSNVFRSLRQWMPHGPPMNSEFYTGWLTHWSESFQTANTVDVINTLKSMLQEKINFNFYMFFGGTNFEFTAGANYGKSYTPDITSYDYDAPMTEAGDPTPKYFEIRKTLEQYFPEVKNLQMPTNTEKGDYGTVELKPRIKLLSSKGRHLLGKIYAYRTGQKLPTFEECRQRSGLLLYETHITPTDGRQKATANLTIARPADRVYVYIDAKFQGVVSRMDQNRVPIIVNYSNSSKLSLLVENQGRINYGPKLKDFKGILGNVELDGSPVKGQWIITGFPLESVNVTADPITTRLTISKGPVLFEGEFTIDETTKPEDTFLNPTGWGKGYAWINGHNLGRYWPDMGPQVTLYVPGVWLHPAPAINRLQLLELEPNAKQARVRLVDRPVLCGHCRIHTGEQILRV